jgi:very-short-patch-repair endonuclease
MTPAELVLWGKLRNRQLKGLKFRRQHPIGRLIVDFYCPAYRLVVEVDGGIHEKQLAEDQERDQWLTEPGYQVIRVTNKEVERDLETVLQRITELCQP